MSGIRYGVGNLDVWAQFRIAIGFGTGGQTILACMECGDQVTADPDNPKLARGVLLGLLAHVEACPPRPKLSPPDGPVAMEIVERGKYKFFTAPNNDGEDDAA